MKKKLKNIDLFVRIASIITICIAIFVWTNNSLFYKTTQQTIVTSQQDDIEIQTPTSQTTTIAKLQILGKKNGMLSGPAYNYKQMLKLITVYKQMQKTFYSEFDTFIKDFQNYENLKIIYAQFKKEKQAFRKYMEKTKAYHKRALSYKKQNTLRYYLRVIEESIDELKEMIAKFEIQLLEKQA